MADASETAAQLVRRVESVLDTNVRIRYVRHVITQSDPVGVAGMMAVVIARAEAHEPAYGSFLLVLSLALAEITSEFRNAIAAAATSQNQLEVARLLLPPEATMESRRAAIRSDRDGRPLTLGERKSLARKTDRRLLARVIRDPHPDVVKILLGNPILTENDVVRLCAMRPVSPEVLREVFRHPKWVLRPRVRIAMVKNPSTPLDIAMQLVPHLPPREALEVANSADLPTALREACDPRMERPTLH